MKKNECAAFTIVALPS